MDHTIVHFEIPSDDPERAARFYRELFGWTINKFAGTAAGGIEYWGKSPVPGMGWFAQLADTEGNVFAIWETDPSAGPASEASRETAKARR
jgi:predicted enzyme related to lactoylglutathione lyase